MTKRREKSDGRTVPEGRRKTVPTTAKPRGGKATTASEDARQLGLRFETADSPQGDDDVAGAGQPAPATIAAPKSKSTKRNVPPAMTMEEVADEENLKRAFKEVASNKGAPGPDRQSIDEVRKHLARLLPALRRALLDGTYQPGMVRRVWIPKSGGGQRGLGIPNVVDRIVQQAVLRILSPHHEPTFHESSHGFRPGRSCHTAIAEARRHVEEGYAWVVDLDLEKFFDRVHHERLLARLGDRIADPRILRLVRRMLKAKIVMPNGVVVSSEEGTPQGGPLSPLLSNIVLDELDCELARRGHRFVRYADDCNIYVRSERSGQRVMASVVRFIDRRLRLKVNADKSAVARPWKRHFVGFRLKDRPIAGGSEVLFSQRTVDRAYEKIRALVPRNLGQAVDACIKRVNEYLCGWINFFGICTVGEVRTLRELDAHIRRRLRALLLRQWKRKRFIARRLIRLGVRRQTAWRTVLQGRRSWWALSHAAGVDHALPTKYFEGRGLLSLEKRWRARQQVVVAPGQLTLALGQLRVATPSLDYRD